MSDNIEYGINQHIGLQIRELRLNRGWTLAELAREAGTSAPAIHRYESGWDRFEIATLRKIASALGARLQIRLVPARRAPAARKMDPKSLVKLLSPLFWDTDLAVSDLDDHPLWVLARVLMYGDLKQVEAARVFFGDDLVEEAIAQRVVDERTRNYWTIILGGGKDAPQGSRQ